MNQADFPIYSRVVSLHKRHIAGRSVPASQQRPAGSVGTVVAHTEGPISGQPRVVVLFDGFTQAVNMNPCALVRLA